MISRGNGDYDPIVIGMIIGSCVRTDGLTAEDPSQRDHAGVLGVVKFREPFPGNLP